VRSPRSLTCILALILVFGGSALPAWALECNGVTYRVTVIAPGGTEERAPHCALGALASWLHLTPDATILPSRPRGDLGSPYVVRLEDISQPEIRQLLQLQLYPEAPKTPVVFLAEPGYIETEIFTGSVSRGWRVLDPQMGVPVSLMALGVPEAGPHQGPDAVSLLFLAALVAGSVAMVARLRKQRDEPVTPT
jgi:hypothetical protein